MQLRTRDEQFRADGIPRCLAQCCILLFCKIGYQRHSRNNDQLSSLDINGNLDHREKYGLLRLKPFIIGPPCTCFLYFSTKRRYPGVPKEKTRMPYDAEKQDNRHQVHSFGCSLKNGRRTGSAKTKRDK